MAELDPLRPREAVADAVHRAILGIDSNDRELFASACLQDESMVFGAGERSLTGWKAINEYMERIFALKTTHFVTNIRVHLKDAKTASLTANTLAYHVRPEDAFKPEDTSFTGGSLYNIDLVKDESDGLWKIKTWKLDINWTTGDRAVIGG